MKVLIIFFMMVFHMLAFADELRVEINPPRPVAGEVFQAFFRIFTEADEEPVINFSPSGLEVVGKSNQGVSTRTVYANGKLTVTREMTFVYDLVSSRPGTASIRDINVKMGQATLRHQSLSFQVLKEPEVMPEVFVKAEVSQENAFVGQGIMVRYYIYHKGSLSNLDVKKYPKLDNFLKRFVQEPERSERVSVDGQVFVRSQIYAAKVFPEKPGQLKIDSLQLSATYAQVRPGDPFGAFGLSRDFKTRSIQSETVKIEVRPVPEPIPANFTGLVGKHDIQLEFGATKLIVNQPLEVKLTMSGGGALENVEAPGLIKNPSLEEFETNGDLKINNPEHATKTFNYTYLAKDNLKLPASDLSLSYFDPASEKYVSVPLNIPEIVIAGGGTLVPKNESPKKDSPATDVVKSASQKVSDFASPIISSPPSVKKWLPYINLALAVFAIVVTLGWTLRGKFSYKNSNIYEIPASFKKGKFSVGDFARWISPAIQKSGKSPMNIIRESDLDDATKKYFVDLLNAHDQSIYAANKSEERFQYNAKNFKNLGKYIASMQNGNSSQS